MFDRFRTVKRKKDGQSSSPGVGGPGRRQHGCWRCGTWVETTAMRMRMINSSGCLDCRQVVQFLTDSDMRSGLRSTCVCDTGSSCVKEGFRVYTCGYAGACVYCWWE
eukprot:GHVU01202878.1.p2 GENE.GHVU01202878.1~~GHVU01202878.1.p2  ORF type:complete len:107 (+),score=6.40 GHVU01202878.1:736-1056(+)